MLNDSSKMKEQTLLEQVTAICQQLEFTQRFSNAPDKLSLLRALLPRIHSSGFPKPIEFVRAIDMLREEKFSMVREAKGDSAEICHIQNAIDKLKKLKQQAELMHTPVAVQRDWGVSLEGIAFWIFWLCLQMVIIGFSYFILPPPGSCINYLTVANAVLLLISVLCKSYIGLTITSAQIVMHFISLVINHLMHH